MDAYRSYIKGKCFCLWKFEGRSGSQCVAQSFVKKCRIQYSLFEMDGDVAEYCNFQSLLNFKLTDVFSKYFDLPQHPLVYRRS